MLLNPATNSSYGSNWHQNGSISPSFLPAQESHCYQRFHMLITVFPCRRIGCTLDGWAGRRTPLHLQTAFRSLRMHFPSRAALPLTKQHAVTFFSFILFLNQTPREAFACTEGRGTKGSRDPAWHISCALNGLYEHASSTRGRVHEHACARSDAEAFPVCAGLRGSRVQPAPVLLVPKRQVGILAPPPPGCESKSIIRCEPCQQGGQLSAAAGGEDRSKQYCQLLGETS